MVSGLELFHSLPGKADLNKRHSFSPVSFPTAILVCSASTNMKVESRQYIYRAIRRTQEPRTVTRILDVQTPPIGPHQTEWWTRHQDEDDTETGE